MSTNKVIPLHEGIEAQEIISTAPPITHPGMGPVAIEIETQEGTRLRNTRRSRYETREAVVLNELRSMWPFGELPAEAIAALVGVEVSTARRWRRDRSLPEPIQLLGHILTTGDLGAIHPGWAGWKLHQGELSGPNSRRPFTATELDMHPITVQRVSALEATVRRQEIELQLLRRTVASTPEKRKLENAEHRTWQIERLAELMLSEFGVTVHECVSEVECATSVELTGQIDSAYQRNDAATTAEAGAEAAMAAMDAAKRIRALCRKQIDDMNALESPGGLQSGGSVRH